MITLGVVEGSRSVVFLIELGLTVRLAAASWYLFETPILKQKWRWPMPSRRRMPLSESATGALQPPQVRLGMGSIGGPKSVELRSD
jgi:peptidoglycan/LPS O-acetylase OafA/YrhL